MAYGYAIGNGFLNRYSPVDIATSNFINAAGITDATIIKAVDTLVRGLKANGTWQKFHALYPFVGGTALSHSFNLVNPAQYQVVWSASGVTHDSTGITGDGISGYGDTQYVTQVANQNNMHLSVYVRNDLLGKCVIGTINTSSIIVSQIYPKYSSNIMETDINQGTALTASNSNSKGHYIASRTASNSIKGYKDNLVKINSTLNSSGVSDRSVFLLARNASVTHDYSAYNIAMASIGSGLNDTEVSLVYDAVQVFQTTLIRQV